jgi:hypothetical protein
VRRLFVIASTAAKKKGNQAMTMPDTTTLTIIQLALSAGILLLLIFIAALVRNILMQLSNIDFTSKLWRRDWNLINAEELQRKEAPPRFSDS